MPDTQNHCSSTIVLTALLMIMLSVSAHPAVDSAGGPSVRFLPEQHLSADISRYLLYQNDYFREVYYLESEIFIEPVWVMYRDLAGLITSFEVNPGMGQKGLANVLFDPLAINYAITTVFEFRLRPITLQLGEDHRCFHEIDRKDFPTVYWNMLYLAAASPNYRIYPFAKRILEQDTWSLMTRLSWYARWGVFLKGFFDIVTDSNVDYENNRVHEGFFQARYAFARWRTAVFCAVGSTRIGLWEERPVDGGGRTGCWQQIFGGELGIQREAAGFGAFINYILDDIPMYRGKPRFSRDGLLEIGLRLFL